MRMGKWSGEIRYWGMGFRGGEQPADRKIDPGLRCRAAPLDLTMRPLVDGRHILPAVSAFFFSSPNSGGTILLNHVAPVDVPAAGQWVHIEQRSPNDPFSAWR
jgi:hypothetical protein